MEENKGFWYADWSFPIFVGLLSSGVFAGTHMYYLYGIGAFNEVAFVAMLKAGMDTGVYGAVAAFGASFLFARIIEGSLVGILDIGGAIQTGVGLGVPALLLGAGFVFPVANFIASLITGLVIGLAIGYIIILARKFTINQSDSTYGADVMMGAGNASGRFSGAADYPQRYDGVNSHWSGLSGGRAAVLYLAEADYRRRDFRPR
ncbi:membrane protein [Salmonella enterica subsp. salamae]|uniref:Membrane protein n=1 Tax=Salmonella enterica subsp. salamae TaxID=59202 RepID=A0A6D2GF65_SALER|nr:membrane protein [Salmonella enterica subsp. salamae]